MAWKVQFQYTWLHIGELQCYACEKKSNTYWHGSSKYKLFSFGNSLDVLGFNLCCFWEVGVYACQYFP